MTSQLLKTQKVDNNVAPTLIQSWRWWLVPALLALTLALIFVDPFAGEWDAVDYTILAIHGKPSSMFMGRMLFIFFNHALWCIAHWLFGLPVDQAYLLFKYAVVAQSPLVVIAAWTLTRDLTSDKLTATLAALIVAMSPTFIMYSGQAMTEVPSLLVLTVGLIVHLRGLRRRKLWMILCGAALLGLNVNVREVMGFYGVWLVVAPFVYGWRFRPNEMATTALACLVFLVCAIGPFAIWFALDVDNYRAGWYPWLESVRSEGSRHPVSLANYGPLMLFFLFAAPVALLSFPFAAWKEWRENRLSLILALAIVGLLANLALIGIYSVTIAGRYLLTGLIPLVPLTAKFLTTTATTITKARWPAFGLATLLSAVISTTVGSTAFHYASGAIAAHGYTKGYDKQLAILPRDAVLLAGRQTLATNYFRGLGLGEWETIGTGGGWPGSRERLIEVIENYLRNGRRVFLDKDPRWWSIRGWKLEETRALISLESHFRFRRVTDTIYEIRPPDDQTAQDKPELYKLLSENQ